MTKKYSFHATFVISINSMTPDIVLASLLLLLILSFVNQCVCVCVCARVCVSVWTRGG